MSITNKHNNKATQTLFRTLSKNNYALEEMIDRKANIMITTNAIIISVILGSALCQPVVATINPKLILLLLSVWVTSIILALYAIKPFLVCPRNQQWDKHKLLNLHAVNEYDLISYKERFFKTLRKEEDIYESMIEDVYQIGRNIKRKHKFLALAAYFFLIGIILSLLFYGFSLG